MNKIFNVLQQIFSFSEYFTNEIVLVSVPLHPFGLSLFVVLVPMLLMTAIWAETPVFLPNILLALHKLEFLNHLGKAAF